MKFIPLLLACAISMQAFTQQSYEITGEGQQKILKGIITRDLIAKDADFPWFQQNQNGYTPPAAAVTALKAASSNIQFLVFGGTWCDDTRYVLPRFYSLLDAAGVNDTHVTLVGVDRNKKTFSNLTDALGVKNVPTIIALKDGKELGRVVEYGKSGSFDKDLGEILQK